MYKNHFSTILFLARFYYVYSFFNPCSDNGNIGDSCDKDTDCNGFAVVCVLGKCQCHQYYQEQRDDQSLPKRSCVKLPDKIGQSCSGTVCRFPMFCTDNQCSCIRAKVENDQCFADFQLSSECSRNYECAQPFTACVGGRCQCVQGTELSGSVCVAKKQCPTGAQPQGDCVRTSNNEALIQNIPNSGGRVDDCPRGSYCYTTNVSEYGFCCPSVCPMSMEPDDRFTCDPQATDDTACPSLTHYCHRQAGQSYSSTVCCLKPCSDPTPVFVHNQCYPLAYLGGPCSVNEQCDGGYGMTCSKNLCVCSPGFIPLIANLTAADENPAQTCVRDCQPKDKFVYHNGECFPVAGLQQACTVNEQCPANSICFRGLCICDCRKGYTLQNGLCVQPLATTGKPLLPVVKPLLPPVTAASPGGTNNLLNIINSLLGTNKNGG